MQGETQKHNADHYNSELYQRSVELERMCYMGVDAQEVYDRETDFALRVANMTFDENDRILDLASGAGNHMACMNKRLGGKPHIEGLDRSDKLVDLGHKSVLAGVRQTVRNHLTIHIGDMADIPAALPEKNARYKLITCLGTSFIYLNKAKREKALSDVLSLLSPGGKVLFQWRQPDLALRETKKEDVMKAWGDRFSIGFETKRGVPDTDVLMDLERGDAFYHYETDTPHPDPAHRSDYEEYKNHKGHVCYREKDTGVPYSTFGRAYIPSFGDKPNEEVDLDTTTTNGFLWTDNKELAMKSLQDIGFTNVAFHEDGKPIGFHKLYAIEATKPTFETERAIASTIEYWQNH